MSAALSLTGDTSDLQGRAVEGLPTGTTLAYNLRLGGRHSPICTQNEGLDEEACGRGAPISVRNRVNSHYDKAWGGDSG